jgi:hypothetical protein
MAKSSGRSHNPFFGMSMLDVLSCALGGVLLLVFLLQRQNQQTVSELEQDRQQLAQQLLDLKRGISVPLPLAIQIHWEGTGDIDLSVVKDGGERVWYPVEERRRTWGELMRDETEGVIINSELFLSPRPEAGQYDVYVWYYGGGDRSQYLVRGEIVLYPGEPSHSRRRQFQVELSTSTPRQWIRVARYRLVITGSRVEIEWLD